jgi:hypothetical protein
MGNSSRTCFSGLVILRPQVAGFAAGLAVIQAVFAQPHVKLRMAETAVADAFAPGFRRFALKANKLFGHKREGYSEISTAAR